MALSKEGVGLMDHTYADEHQIAHRYLLGKLSPEEKERFEEHYLGCRECVADLEAAQALHLGLRGLAAREAAAGALRLGLLARLARLSRSRQAAVLGMTLAAAVLVPALLALKVGRLDREVGRLRAAAAPRGALPGGLRQAPPGAPAEAELRALRSDLDRARREAEEERRRRAGLAERLARAREPLGGAPLILLGAQRAAGAAPAVRVALPPPPGWVVFSLDLAETGFERYRATLLGPGGAAVWQGRDLAPAADGSLTVLVPAERLAPGDYVFLVEGLSAGRRSTPAGRFAFRAVRP
jgi:putative zinc finger protein